MLNMAEHQFTKELLKEMQSWDLDKKIAVTLTRIKEFANHFPDGVYVSFSGGKDSTVLLDLVRKVIPDVPVVFSNTGLEYPEIQAFARSKGAMFIRPKMSFVDVITNYGYPVISKEVSETIYYARRIRRERERERERELSNTPFDVNGFVYEPQRFFRTPIRKRKELLGQREDECCG